MFKVIVEVNSCSNCPSVTHAVKKCNTMPKINNDVSEAYDSGIISPNCPVVPEDAIPV